MAYYFAYLRKIAWPQVNRSEAKDNAIGVKLSYHLFANVALAGHECARCESCASRRKRRTACTGAVGLNKPESKWTRQIILLNFENCNWKTWKSIQKRGQAVGQIILVDFPLRHLGVCIYKVLVDVEQREYSFFFFFSSSHLCCFRAEKICHVYN